MPDNNRKLRVFLCHASQDKPVVRELHQRLLAEGWIDPWLDEEKLLPGQDWDIEIEKAVESTDVVIVLLSNNSVTKEGYIQKELRFVLDISNEKPDETIFVIPVRLDDCSIPRRLKKWQYVDYFPSGRKDWALKRLFQSLETRSGKMVKSKMTSVQKAVDVKENNDSKKVTRNKIDKSIKVEPHRFKQDLSDHLPAWILFHEKSKSRDEEMLQIISKLMADTSSQVVLVLSGGNLRIFAGLISSSDAKKVASMINQHMGSQETLLRFVRLDSLGGSEHMLYATRHFDGTVLAIIFNAAMPLQKIKQHADRFLIEICSS
jgi:hypothetical protein